MKIPALLLSLLLPGCGDGIAGVAVPAPMDMTAIVRPSSPNTALAAPAGFKPTPDVVTPTYDVTPDRLYSLICGVAASEKRVYPQISYDDRLQAHFVARSALMGLPDLIAVQVLPAATPQQALLVIYSRSVYGHSDLGVNRGRVDAWLTALAARLAATPAPHA